VDVTVLVPSGATTGASVDVSDFTGMWFELDGVTAATCTVVLEGSIDQTHFFACTGSITADGLVEVPQNIKLVRANRTVAGSGAVTCVGWALVISP
jgi:hypothetical protein